jgi:hypothetical protein
MKKGALLSHHSGEQSTILSEATSVCSTSKQIPKEMLTLIHKKIHKTMFGTLFLTIKSKKHTKWRNKI